MCKYITILKFIKNINSGNYANYTTIVYILTQTSRRFA